MPTTPDISENSISYLLKLTQHSLRLQMDAELKELSLTTPQYAVLAQLQKNPGTSNAALARASFITAQTMHGIVSILEKRNLIKRTPDPEHGRILCAKLTKQGLSLVKSAHKSVQNSEDKMMQKLSTTKRATLKKILHECIENLQK
jgi:DNA-binding MarR family transcriptional regulator